MKTESKILQFKLRLKIAQFAQISKLNFSIVVWGWKVWFSAKPKTRFVAMGRIKKAVHTKSMIGGRLVQCCPIKVFPSLWELPLILPRVINGERSKEEGCEIAEHISLAWKSLQFVVTLSAVLTANALRPAENFHVSKAQIFLGQKKSACHI